MRLFEGLTRTLTEFLEQRDDLALILRCTDGDGVAVIKSLGMLDESRSELFWIHGDPFTTAPIFVADIVAAFAAKHAAVSAALPSRSLPPWPPLPASATDETQPPAQRLRELIAFSGTLTATPGAPTVWALFPAEIGNGEAWAKFLADVLRHEFPRPWCRGIRFYLRDDAANPAVERALKDRPRLRWRAAELGPAAVRRALDEDADDGGMPLDQRLQSLFASAQIDAAHGRLQESLAAFGTMLPYYIHTRNGTMTALALNAVGDVQARLGNVHVAEQCWSSAIAPAAAAPGPPVTILLNSTLSLGNLFLRQGRWSEAEAYYDAGQQLSTVARDARTKLRCIENMGHCQWMQNKVPAALQSWHAVAAVAGGLGLLDVRQDILLRLRNAYAQLQDVIRQQEIEQQLVVAATPSTS
ncbi:MAG: hypothetical protein ABI766_03685 [Gemmatimonadales bacterium]